jgi:hypothetical protein
VLGEGGFIVESDGLAHTYCSPAARSR